ncbi:hypothetical protein [Lysobacter gummosus]|uniref:hypothetical protein n=1 Tax=Lysobacter gummosus TaxID=262324 RepID=UPI0036262941
MAGVRGERRCCLARSLTRIGCGIPLPHRWLRVVACRHQGWWSSDCRVQSHIRCTYREKPIDARLQCHARWSCSMLHCNTRHSRPIRR